MLTMDSVVKTGAMVSVRSWKKKAVLLWKELEINTVFPGFITALINTFCNLFTTKYLMEGDDHYSVS